MSKLQSMCWSTASAEPEVSQPSHPSSASSELPATPISTSKRKLEYFATDIEYSSSLLTTVIDLSALQPLFSFVLCKECLCPIWPTQSGLLSTIPSQQMKVHSITCVPVEKPAGVFFDVKRHDVILRMAYMPNNPALPSWINSSHLMSSRFMSVLLRRNCLRDVSAGRLKTWMSHSIALFGLGALSTCSLVSQGKRRCRFCCWWIQPGICCHPSVSLIVWRLHRRPHEIS